MARDGNSLIPPGSLLARLCEANAADWTDYVGHEFVRRLGDGTLPEPCFRHYLAQDYLFLLNFSRAYGLAVFKSDDIADMRAAAATVDALLNKEIALHVEFCAGWGLDEADMAAVAEEPANMAYTRFVLERGLAGDLLDLLVALAPCVVGYGVIGKRLMAEAAVSLADNPYRAWIELYAGEDYQTVARGAVEQLERVAARRIGPEPAASGRWPDLCRTFGAATRLEVGFWDMGLSPPR